MGNGPSYQPPSAAGGGRVRYGVAGGVERDGYGRPLAPTGPPPPGVPTSNPYATGPYGSPAPHPAMPPGVPMPMTYPPLTPEQLHAAFMAGVPPHALLHPGTMMGPHGGGGWPAPPPPRVESATMIRNDVNLRKSTLRWLRPNSDTRADRLFLDFHFDANSPCAITTYYLVTSNEAVPQYVSLVARIEPTHLQHSNRRVLFSKGLNQHFCQAHFPSEGVHVHAAGEVALTAAPQGPEGVAMPSSVVFAPSSSSSSRTGSASHHLPPATAAAFASLPRHFYPIVVVLETVPESDPQYAMAASAPPTGLLVDMPPDSDELSAAPGGATSAVRLQVTYATSLHKPGEDDRLGPSTEGAADVPPGYVPCRDWSVKPLHQRIQVSGVVYELREIFGMEGNAGSRASATGSSGGGGGGGGGGSTSEQGGDDAGAATGKGGGDGGGGLDDVLSSGSECVICLTEARDTTVLPCRHMCLCYDCAQQLRFASNKCPICRTPIASLLRLKLAASPPPAPSATAAITEGDASASGMAAHMPAAGGRGDGDGVPKAVDDSGITGTSV